MKDLSASIVVYKNKVEILEKTIQSFLRSTLNSRLYIVDNSPSDRLKALVNDPRIIYRFNNKNVGFGAGHNTILRQILNEANYHIILNPDVYFEEGVIQKLYTFMNQHSEIGQVMPKVLYPDGRLQPLCKLLPTPQTLIKRRFLNFHKSSLERENYRYELRFSGYDKIMDVPFLSGCFMFLRTEALKSGRSLMTPVECVRSGTRLYVYVGGADVKQWWRNVLADPNVTVEVGGRDMPALATVHVGRGPDAEQDLLAIVDARPRVAKLLGVAGLPRDAAALARAAEKSVSVRFDLIPAG